MAQMLDSRNVREQVEVWLVNEHGAETSILAEMNDAEPGKREGCALRLARTRGSIATLEAVRKLIDGAYAPERPVRLSTTQHEALQMMSTGLRLVRVPGGFWTTPAIGARDAGEVAPNWYVEIRTVRALEKKGLLRRTFESREEWNDPRVLTDAGKAAAR